MTSLEGYVGIVLAAGASTRFGGPKALAWFDGLTLLEHATTTLRSGGVRCVRVVIAAPHAQAIRTRHRALEFIDNPRPDGGMLSSLRVGLAALGDETVAAVISLVDHPCVTPKTVAALITAHARGDAEVVRPSHGGKAGHPYVIDRAMFAQFSGASDWQHSRAVIRRARTTFVTVDDPGVLGDFDTEEALADARRSRGSLER